jgi:hypothetical protein
MSFTQSIFANSLFFLAAVTAFTAPAQAGAIDLSIDSSLADYVLEVSCSGEPVDEQRLRASKVLQAQIKHHSGLNRRYSMDAYIEGLQAASRCEVPEDDIFRFRYAVEEKETLARAIAFLKAHEDELVGYVVGKTAPYFPADQQFSGAVVLSAAGQSCGGFSMDGAFFIDVPCVAGAIEDEFMAIKVLSAHETYHALQYAFFAPFNEDMEIVDSPAAAQDYLFMSLLTEGTAEFVADSREVTGEGVLATLFSKFAAKGYRRVDTNLRMVAYAAEVLGQEGDSNRRLRDMYALGFMGDTGQPFYYVGAVMAEKIEAAFGRGALLCIMALSPEQFVLSYDAAVAKAGVEATPIGAGAVRAARKLGAGKISWEGCLQ